jgi:hypothetical protein
MGFLPVWPGGGFLSFLFFLIHSCTGLHRLPTTTIFEAFPTLLPQARIRKGLLGNLSFIIKI